MEPLQLAENQATVGRRLIGANERFCLVQFRFGLTTVRGQPSQSNELLSAPEPAEQFLVGAWVIRFRPVNATELLMKIAERGAA